MQKRLKKIILLLGDIAVLYLSLYLTLLVRYFALPSASAWQSHFLPFTIAFIAWIFIFYIADLYNIHMAVNNRKFFVNTVRSAVIAGLLSVVFFYATPSITIAPKRNLLIYLAIFIVLFLLWRRFFNWLLYSKMPKEHLAVIGYNTNVQELIDTLEDKPHLGYEVKLIISSRLPRGTRDDTVITDKITDLEKYITRLRVSSIIFAANPHQSPELRQILFACLPLKINFINLANFYESVTGKIPLEAISQMWFLENLSEGNKKWYNLLKRAYDLALSISILVISAPFWPIIGLLLKIENKETIFISQDRVGQNGRIFHILKFRTQHTVSQDPSPSLANDPRTTKVGNFLRKTRIDEIPQVLNVILGQMSFIGPRPERPELVRRLKYEIPYYEERLLVKPGATGWDQVSGEYHSPSKEDTLKKLQYDLYYVKNRSLYLDMTIVLKTIATIFRRSGV